MIAGALIAVVDDDAAIRNGVSSLLRSAGYSVELFDSAEALLERSAGTPIGVVITDIQMSGMSGLELQTKLRESHPQLPLLVMTAFPEPALRTKALADGARCFLSKPFNAEELLRCVAEALQG